MNRRDFFCKTTGAATGLALAPFAVFNPAADPELTAFNAKLAAARLQFDAYQAHFQREHELFNARWAANGKRDVGSAFRGGAGMTVQPASVNFRLYQYATFSEPVVLKDGNGDPINLTGYSALLHARRDISDPDPVMSFSTANSTIVLGGINGTITLVQLPSVTGALVIDWEGEMWVHDLLLTAPDSSAQRTYQGAIYAYPAVTRP